MNKDDFLTYDQLHEQIPEFKDYGWSKATLKGFVFHHLILGYPDRSLHEYRFHKGDVRHLLEQKINDEEREANR